MYHPYELDCNECKNPDVGILSLAFSSEKAYMKINVFCGQCESEYEYVIDILQVLTFVQGVSVGAKPGRC